MKNLMHRLGAVAFLSFVIGATSVAYAASFDCSKASNRVENLICNDAELSQLDEYMAKLYREARRVQSDETTHLLAQRAWLKQRNQCEHQECLRSAYQQRIDQLAHLTSLGKGLEPASTPVKINKPLYTMQGEGAGVRKKESVDKLTKAFEQFLLGHRYENGDGVPENYMLAKQWYEKSAEKGFSVAQFNLGLMYAHGRGIPQDYMLAKQWIEKAAVQGLAKAQFNLGVMYAQGFGVRQDYQLAKQWYEKAAEQGEALAQFNLGVTYANGLGVRQNYAEAKEWFGKACDNGLQAGCDGYKTMNSK